MVTARLWWRYQEGRVVTRIVGNISEPHHVEELARIVVDLLTKGRTLPRTLNVYAATARRIRDEGTVREDKKRMMQSADSLPKGSHEKTR